jgi:lysophospholipase L1-like esterase
VVLWTVATIALRNALPVSDGDVAIGASARVLADGAVYRAIRSGTGATCWGAVESTQRKRRAYATIACLGDSLFSTSSYSSTVGSTTTYYHDGVCPLTWANVFLGQRLHFGLSLNFGVAGETAAEVAARVGSVIAAAPDVCVVNGGGNDAIQKLSSDVTIAALRSAYEALIAAGILVVALPIFPQGASWWAAMTEGEATTQRLRINRVNRWIRQYCRETAGIVMADPNGALVDVTDADSVGVEAMFASDGLHLSVKGAMHIGDLIADALSVVVAPGASRLPEHNIDMYDAAENPEGNLLENGMMLGTGGTAANEVTGDVATNWTARHVFGTFGAGTIVASKEARTDGVGGDWQVLTFTNLTGGTDLVYALRQEVAGSSGYYAQGDTVEAECEIAVSGADYVESVALIVREYNGAGTAVTVAKAGEATNDRYTAAAWSGIYRTPAITLTAAIGASSALQLDVSITVAGDLGADAVVKVGRVDLRKVT